jgi:hypothetical protein
MAQPPAAKKQRLAADGEPVFTCLTSLAKVFLVFASDFMARAEPSEENKKARDSYLERLGETNPSAAKAFRESQHCSVSFLTDTSTLKLLETIRGLSLADALFNVVIGQTVLADWRIMKDVGAPFRIDHPPTPEEFVQKFKSLYPGRKSVVPSYLKQGVLWLLGPGPEIEACARFISRLAVKIPSCLRRLEEEDDTIEVLQSTLGLPKFRALLVARILALTSKRFLHNLQSRQLGDFAQLGLWLTLGLSAGAARAAVRDHRWFESIKDPLFQLLIEELPLAVAEADSFKVVDLLEARGIRPFCAQNIEHILCEYRKVIHPRGRPARRRAPYEGYVDLWAAVAPTLLTAVQDGRGRRRRRRRRRSAATPLRK